MRVLLIFALILLYSCQNHPAETRADKIAKGICGCTARLLEMNKQAAGTKDSIDFEAIQAEFEKTKACISDQHMKPEDFGDVKKSLAMMCPELAKEEDLLQELMGQ